MQNSDNTLIARRIGLIPREPLIDFGTVEIGGTVSPQRFTVELAPDTQGLITTDADWINISPTIFMKGQTEITVRLLNEKLQSGQQLQGKITAAITQPVNEQRHIPVLVKVRQYSEQEIQAMAEQLAEKQEQLKQQQVEQVQHATKLQVKPQAIDFGEVKTYARMSSQTTDEANNRANKITQVMVVEIVGVIVGGIVGAITEAIVGGEIGNELEQSIVGLIVAAIIGAIAGGAAIAAAGLVAAWAIGEVLDRTIIGVMRGGIFGAVLGGAVMIPGYYDFCSDGSYFSMWWVLSFTMC